MGWAQVWRSKSNPEYLLNSLNIASHAQVMYVAMAPSAISKVSMKLLRLKKGTRCIYRVCLSEKRQAYFYLNDQQAEPSLKIGIYAAYKDLSV